MKGGFQNIEVGARIIWCDFNIIQLLYKGVAAILGFIKNRVSLSRYLADLNSTVKAVTGANQFWMSIIQSSGYDFSRPVNAAYVFFRLKNIVQKINGARSTNYLLRRYPRGHINRSFERLRVDLANVETVVLPKDRYEAALAYYFLEHMGLSDSAHRDFSKMGILPDMVNLRHYYYGNILVQHVRDVFKGRPTLTVVEIGGGGCRLKVILKYLLAEYSVTYVDIDLPEMLPVGIFSHMSLHPAVEFSINDIARDVRDHFIDTTRFKNLDIAGIDLFINTHSFQEMSFLEIGKYFDFFYSVSSPNALFFNTNWLQRKMPDGRGGLYSNHPENYPYQTAGNIFLVDEEDRFYVCLRGRFNYKPYLLTRTVLQHIGALNTKIQSGSVSNG